MQRMRSKLEDLARRAREHMPSTARGMLERLEGAYRARRSPPQPATPAGDETAPSPTPPTAPTPQQPRPVNWELRSQADIVAHIEQHYHAGLRRDLPALVEAARRVEREHARHAAAPVGLASLLDDFAAELEAHMLKEERVLFPVLRTGARGGPIDMPIRMMEREHDAHDEQLERLRELTHDFSAPADAPLAWQELYASLATLETELRQHIYLENNVLFARAAGGEY
jgi:regulator of cell morphogenesis and NO signaling